MNKWKLAFIGLLSGFFLGGILYIIEIWSTKKVYVLLMNVDYIPFLNQLPLHPIAEFSLHLFVSVILVFALYYFLKTIQYEQKLVVYVLINGLIGALLYVTTSFSNRTPELTDGVAFLYWFFAHLAYGWMVGSFVIYGKRNR